MIKTKAKLLKDYQDKLSSLKFLDPAAGFRVIIMTQANSQVITRVLELISKFKTRKMNCCAV